PPWTTALGGGEQSSRGFSRTRFRIPELRSALTCSACFDSAAPQFGATRSMPLRRALQLGDLELAHLQHGLHGTPRASRVRVCQQLAQPVGHHLLGYPPAVLEPAAPSRRTAVRERRREAVHPGLFAHAIWNDTASLN